MSVAHIEFLVEELSMEAALRIIVPRIVGELSFEVYPYQGKQDLLGKLPDRLRGYAKWLPTDWRIVVLMDRDDDSCNTLKTQLEDAASGARLRTRSAAKDGEYQVITRLAIEELEAWYFGDWQAVLLAYPRTASNIPRRPLFRDPDAIAGGTWEALERILRRAGHFRSGLRKIEAARSIAQHMDPDRNRSRSFQILRDSLREMTMVLDSSSQQS
jgi:hypothetical protein